MQKVETGSPSQTNPAQQLVIYGQQESAVTLIPKVKSNAVLTYNALQREWDKNIQEKALSSYNQNLIVENKSVFLNFNLENAAKVCALCDQLGTEVLGKELRQEVDRIIEKKIKQRVDYQVQAKKKVVDLAEQLFKVKDLISDAEKKRAAESVITQALLIEKSCTLLFDYQCRQNQDLIQDSEYIYDVIKHAKNKTETWHYYINALSDAQKVEVSKRFLKTSDYQDAIDMLDYITEQSIRDERFKELFDYFEHHQNSMTPKLLEKI